MGLGDGSDNDNVGAAEEAEEMEAEEVEAEEVEEVEVEEGVDTFHLMLVGEEAQVVHWD